MSAIASQTWWMTQRRLKAFILQPGYLVITLIQPVVWLFLFAAIYIWGSHGALVH